MKAMWNGEQRDIKAVWMEGEVVKFIDQRPLPHSFEIIDARSVEDVARYIRDMVVRGAPAIGVAAAYGMALAGLGGLDLDEAARTLGGTRPTAQDLFHAIEHMKREIEGGHEIVEFEHDPTVFRPFVESVFLHLEQYESFYRVMLGRQGDPLFQVLFQELLSELIFEPIIDANPEYARRPEFEMNRRFFSAGFAGLVLWWLEKGKPITVEQASLQITRDILPVYLQFLSK